jgi:hypothetical protein
MFDCDVSEELFHTASFKFRSGSGALPLPDFSLGTDSPKLGGWRTVRFGLHVYKTFHSLLSGSVYLIKLL